MVLSGEYFHEILLEYLFKIISVNKSAQVMIQNLIPYDASLQKFVMRNNGADAEQVYS